MIVVLVVVVQRREVVEMLLPIHQLGRVAAASAAKQIQLLR